MGSKRLNRSQKDKGKGKHVPLELQESASELEVQQMNRSPNGQNIPTQNQFDDEASQMNELLQDQLNGRISPTRNRVGSAANGQNAMLFQVANGAARHGSQEHINLEGQNSLQAQSNQFGIESQ